MFIRSVLATSIVAIVLAWSGICFADATGNQSLELSIKEYNIGYREDINDGESGWVTGYRIAYKNQDPTNNTYWRLLFESTNGSDKYVGATNGTPSYPVQTTTNNLKQTSEAIFACPVSGSPNEHVYIGIGAYNWNRNITGSGGYLEKYSWNYIPVGYRSDYKISDKWDGAVDMAVRFQLNSQMTAYQSGFDPVNFTLGNTPGLKLELPFTCKVNSQWSVVVSPWYEYWGIKQSSWTTMTSGGVPVGSAMEPNSHCDQYGLDIGVVAKF